MQLYNASNLLVHHVSNLHLILYSANDTLPYIYGKTHPPSVQCSGGCSRRHPRVPLGARVPVWVMHRIYIKGEPCQILTSHLLLPWFLVPYLTSCETLSHIVSQFRRNSLSLEETLLNKDLRDSGFSLHCSTYFNLQRRDYSRIPVCI